MNESKFRHELKYLISFGQLTILKQRLSGLIPLDSHVGPEGSYNIRSLYFDDYDNRCYYENLAGIGPREKYRIRIYDHSADRISLECKRKECGKTQKTSCSLLKGQCEQLMQGNPLPDLKSQPPVLRKLTMEMLWNRMHPAVIVEYDRIPYIYKNGNVRITLDSNIFSSRAFGDFLSDRIPKRPVMPAGQQLLEVKYDEYLPDFIYRALQLDSLMQTTYSKYFICRQYTI